MDVWLYRNYVCRLSRDMKVDVWLYRNCVSRLSKDRKVYVNSDDNVSFIVYFNVHF